MLDYLLKAWNTPHVLQTPAQKLALDLVEGLPIAIFVFAVIGVNLWVTWKTSRPA